MTVRRRAALMIANTPADLWRLFVQDMLARTAH